MDLPTIIPGPTVGGPPTNNMALDPCRGHADSRSPRATWRIETGDATPSFRGARPIGGGDGHVFGPEVRPSGLDSTTAWLFPSMRDLYNIADHAQQRLSSYPQTSRSARGRRGGTARRCRGRARPHAIDPKMRTRADTASPTQEMESTPRAQSEPLVQPATHVVVYCRFTCAYTTTTGATGATHLPSTRSPSNTNEASCRAAAAGRDWLPDIQNNTAHTSGFSPTGPLVAACSSGSLRTVVRNNNRLNTTKVFWCVDILRDTGAGTHPSGTHHSSRSLHQKKRKEKATDLRIPPT